MDVHEPPASPVRAAPTRTGTSPEDWSSFRKNRPIERLLPVAERWSEALPPSVRPRALIACYPRIANLLAVQWDDSVARSAYFDDLLVDRRGNRQGFPRPVLDDLLKLRNHSYSAPAD